MATERTHFPCQNCGSQMSYQPGTESLVCSHCGNQHQISVSNRGIDELDFYSALEQYSSARASEVSMTVKCTGCGSEFEFDKNIHADLCPYCGTRIVTDSHEFRHIKPWGVLPFKVTSEQAVNAYSNWLKGLWFAPRKLKKYARRNQKLNGMYAPYWTYDCSTYTRYQGQRGTFYQEPVRVRVKVNGRWTTQTRMVTKIRWQPVSGQVRRSFDDVLIFASNSLPRDMARELSPWDLGNLKPYQDEYLSGFRSEMYQTGLKEGFDIARQRMHPVINNDICADIGGDQQRITHADSEFNNVQFKHILLPFWTAGFRFGKKSYQFVVNGRTGEVQGERPYSKIKIAMAIFAGLILVLIALGALGLFQAGGTSQIQSFDDLIFTLPNFQ